jgi:hypothetical protein
MLASPGLAPVRIIASRLGVAVERSSLKCCRSQILLAYGRRCLGLAKSFVPSARNRGNREHRLARRSRRRRRTSLSWASFDVQWRHPYFRAHRSEVGKHAADRSRSCLHELPSDEAPSVLRLRTQQLHGTDDTHAQVQCDQRILDRRTTPVSSAAKRFKLALPRPRSTALHLGRRAQGQSRLCPVPYQSFYGPRSIVGTRSDVCRFAHEGEDHAHSVAPSDRACGRLAAS